MDIFEELDYETIRNAVDKVLSFNFFSHPFFYFQCSYRDRVRLNMTCKAFDHLFKIEKTWRSVKARGVLFKDVWFFSASHMKFF